MDKPIVIPRLKTVSYTVEDGRYELTKEDDTWTVKYINRFYKGSPFTLPVTYSSSFTPEQIVEDSEVLKFMERFKY